MPQAFWQYRTEGFKVRYYQNAQGLGTEGLRKGGGELCPNIMPRGTSLSDGACKKFLSRQYGTEGFKEGEFYPDYDWQYGTMGFKENLTAMWY